MAINFPNNPAVNDTFTVGGTTFTFTGVKWESSAVVEVSSDTTPQLGGDLNGGTKNINNVGVITATSFSGNGSLLTGLTGAAAATYGGASVSPQITVDAGGRITNISNVSISGGGGGGGATIILKDSQSLVGAAGTIDFGTGLSVSAISAGVGTVGINTTNINAETLNVTGISTLGNVLVGGATTDVVITGDLRVTGVATFGSSSTTIDGGANTIRVGTALTLGHTQGLQFHTQNIHSEGFEVNNINATGIVTAISYSGITTSMISDYGGGLGGGGDSFPTGGIILWSGAANNIPTGWVLCDGQNSTPDLRNRFVVGAGDAYAVDATGGSADATLVSHTHGSGNLGTGNAGSHSHSGNTNNTGDHSHSGNTNNTGSHAHRWGTDDNDGASGAGNPDANGGQTWKAWTDDQGAHSHNINTNNSGSHSHNINTNNTGDHSHNVSGDTASSGSSATGANLPPYYALCYIMKS
jgi:hypothetical protein|tara:strand:+ start:1710 stop:3116 length:1407 start_codon:yes stop_codon:yes gene_type:complete